MVEVCSPWLMMHVIGQRHLSDAHMPRPCIQFWLMSDALGQRCFPVTHMPRLWVQAFVEATCHWPMLLA